MKYRDLRYLSHESPYGSTFQETYNMSRPESADDGRPLKFNFEHRFCSEAPDGEAQKLMLLWNHNPWCIFEARQHSVPCSVLIFEFFSEFV